MRIKLNFRMALGAAMSIMMIGCVATPDYQPITTKDEYLTKVVGRTVSLGDGSSTTNADGTITGQFGGKPIVGTWTWEDGLFCREGTVGAELMERDCQRLEIAGDNLRVTRNSGKGSQSQFRLK